MEEIVCAIANIGRHATTDEVIEEVATYKYHSLSRKQIEDLLEVLAAIGEVTRHDDGWWLCPMEQSIFAGE